jgi:hypothetical protein
LLTPNNFTDLDRLEQTLLEFGRHYEQIAKPFEWKLTRKDPRPSPRAPRPTSSASTNHTHTSARRMSPKSVNELGKTTTKPRSTE